MLVRLSPSPLAGRWTSGPKVPKLDYPQTETDSCFLPPLKEAGLVRIDPMTSDRLARVRVQLRLYEHPLVEFDARDKGEAVEVIIRPRFSDPPVHTYYFELHPRDLDDPQFEWAFQRQIFDCLHDYVVEMFIRTPQHRKEHQQMEREGKL